jgi:hypothetical protein
MKTKHLLILVLIAAFSSCSSAFRTGQTPDDVYYSPAPPPAVEYVTTENQQDRDSYAYNNANNGEDLAIRRGIRDPRYRGNVSLDFGYGYGPYDYYGSSFFNPYSSYYNPYSYSGVYFYPNNYNYYGYYSPFNSYYYQPVYGSKYGNAVSTYTGPRTYNLGVYNRAGTNTNSNANRVYSHPGESSVSPAPVRTFSNQPANRSGVGNFIRRVLSPSDNGNNNRSRSYSIDNNSGNNNSSPSRTIQTNTSGSSSSSSSGSSAPVRTFRR